MRIYVSCQKKYTKFCRRLKIRQQKRFIFAQLLYRFKWSIVLKELLKYKCFD